MTAEYPDYIFGILVSAAGSTFIPLGLVIQKQSHTENGRLGQEVAYYKQPRWLAGFLVFLCGHILDAASQAFAPAVMLSSLGAWGMVASAIFARVLLGEHISCFQVFGMLGTVGGVILVVLGTPNSASNNIWDIASISMALTSFEFMCLCASSLALVGICYFIAFFVKPVIVPVFWAFVAALSGAYAFVFTKCVVLSVTAPSISPWSHFQFYILVPVWLSLAVGSMHFINIGLRQGAASLVVPTFNALSMLCAIVVAAILLKELDGWSSPTQIGLFCSGAFLALLSIVVMSTQLKEGDAAVPAPTIELLEHEEGRS